MFRTIEAKDASYCDDGMGEFLERITGGNSELLRWRKALEQDLGIGPIRLYDGRPIYKILPLLNIISFLIIYNFT